MFKIQNHTVLILILYYDTYLYFKNNEDEETELENIIDLDNNYDVEPMLDLCSEYVMFLLEEEKNRSIVKEEVKEVFLYTDIL